MRLLKHRLDDLENYSSRSLSAPALHSGARAHLRALDE